MPRKATFLILALLAVVAGVCGYYLIHPNRAVIRNRSGAELHDVHLVLRDLQDKVYLEERMDRLAPRDEIVFRHGHNDSRGKLRFLLKDQQHSFDEEYIDLWTGEGWVFEILDDGKVQTNYDYPRSD